MTGPQSKVVKLKHWYFYSHWKRFVWPHKLYSS